METTTIRVETTTRDRLRAMATAAGTSIQDVVREAVDALERGHRIDETRRALARLQADPRAWAAYLAEGESLPVGDGIT